MNAKQVLLVFVLLSMVAVGTVSAQNVSISDIGYVGPQIIELYSYNGTLLGTYNTTSTGIELPESDFYLVVKPELKNLEPVTMLSTAMSWIVQYWYVIVFFFGGVILMTRRW